MSQLYIHIYQLYFHILFHAGYYRILNRVPCADKTWSTGEGDGKPLQYSCLEKPMKSMERKKDGAVKEELPRSVGAQHGTGDQRTKNCRRNEGTEPKQKRDPAVDGTGDGSRFSAVNSDTA